MKKFKKEDFCVGQEVYLLQLFVGRNKISKGQIITIGRKYIYVKKDYETIKFDITNDFKVCSEYLSSAYHLCRDLNDVHELIYMREFYLKIIRFHRWNDLDYEKALLVQNIVLNDKPLYCAIAMVKSHILTAHTFSKEDAKELLTKKYNDVFSENISSEDFEEKYPIHYVPVNTEKSCDFFIETAP